MRHPLRRTLLQPVFLFSFTEAKIEAKIEANDAAQQPILFG